MALGIEWGILGFSKFNTLSLPRNKAPLWKALQYTSYNLWAQLCDLILFFFPFSFFYPFFFLFLFIFERGKTRGGKRRSNLIKTLQVVIFLCFSSNRQRLNEWKHKSLKKYIDQPAVAERLVSFLLIHNSFALILVGEFIIAASNKQISIWKTRH